MHDLKYLCSHYKIAANGVIHIGAHDGQELPVYQSLGMRRILLIEANPVAYERLTRHVQAMPNVRTVQYAVCHQDGFVPLRVTNSDASSSLLPLKGHKLVFPDIKEDYQTVVPGRKLDTLLRELKVKAADYNFLNIDIQGAELLAFQGATDVLKHMEAINTEVNFAELYEGCALVDQVDDYLGSFGFRRMMTTLYHPSFGDAFYIRR